MSVYQDLSILGHLLPECCRPPGLMARLIRRRWRRSALAYRGGLNAEKQSLKTISRTAKIEVRKAYLRERGGRRIDLLAILSQRLPANKDSAGRERPRWALADPSIDLHAYNGGIREFYNGEGYGAIYRVASCEIRVPNSEEKAIATCEPAGIPPLPPVARRFLTNKRIRRRARWIGLLWQPDEWRITNPDPAIIVEWRDLPGQYYCLAVWGHDGPEIKEFYL